MIGLWTLSAFRLEPPSRTLSTLQAVVQPPLTFCSPYTIKQNLGRKRKALGRGQANGKGKRGGRGNKGYKARNHRAFPTPGFEGGQSGLIKALPKIGHQAQQKTPMFYTSLQLDTLQYLIDKQKLDASKPITLKELFKVGGIGKIRDGIALTARGLQFFNAKVNLEVSTASPAAIEAVERNGGSVKCVYHSKQMLDYLAHPETYVTPPSGVELPATKGLLETYMDAKKKGYLAPLVQNVPKDEQIRELIKKTVLQSRH